MLAYSVPKHGARVLVTECAQATSWRSSWSCRWETGSRSASTALAGTSCRSLYPTKRARPDLSSLSLQICMRLGCSVESIVLIVENLSRLH
jgi:hypothetical protein